MSHRIVIVTLSFLFLNTMSLPEYSTVLIVGAGPSGLAAALSLIHHGCRDFVIVDAIVEGQNASRAITIHSATVEVRHHLGAHKKAP
jgi:2-polyprenyl-6-methoxyphenol hydroxylase-like FAD-dependent oxidoreductase